MLCVSMHSESDRGTGSGASCCAGLGCCWAGGAGIKGGARMRATLLGPMGGASAAGAGMMGAMSAGGGTWMG